MRDRRRPTCSPTSIPTPPRSTSTSAAAAVTDRTRAVIPVHLYGRPAAIPDLGVPVLEDAAQAHGAARPRVGLGRVRRTASIPTKNLGGIGDGGAVVTDDDDLAANLRLLRAHGLTDGYVHTRVADELPAVRDRGGGAAGGSARASPRRTPVGARSRPRYRAAAPEPAVAGAARPPRLPPVRRSRSRSATRSGARLPFETGVHYPRALTQQPAYRQFVAAAVPRGRSVGGGVRVATVLPRDDRRRDRGGVSSTPREPGGRGRSRRSSPVTTTTPPSPRWSASRSRRSTASACATAR